MGLISSFTHRLPLAAQYVLAKHLLMNREYVAYKSGRLCVSYFIGNWCQILMTARATDVVGEIGVLCYMPQPFTVRSRKLSQLLRLDRIVFMDIARQYKEDGQRIVDNLLQVEHLTRTCPIIEMVTS